MSTRKPLVKPKNAPNKNKRSQTSNKKATNTSTKKPEVKTVKEEVHLKKVEELNSNIKNIKSKHEEELKNLEDEKDNEIFYLRIGILIVFVIFLIFNGFQFTKLSNRSYIEGYLIKDLNNNYHVNIDSANTLYLNNDVDWYMSKDSTHVEEINSKVNDSTLVLVEYVGFVNILEDSVPIAQPFTYNIMDVRRLNANCNCYYDEKIND